MRWHDQFHSEKEADDEVIQKERDQNIVSKSHSTLGPKTSVPVEFHLY